MTPEKTLVSAVPRDEANHWFEHALFVARDRALHPEWGMDFVEALCWSYRNRLEYHREYLMSVEETEQETREDSSEQTELTEVSA